MLLYAKSGNTRINLLSESEGLDVGLYHLLQIIISSITFSILECLVYLCKNRSKVSPCDLNLDLLSGFSSVSLAAQVGGNLLVRFDGADSH